MPNEGAPDQNLFQSMMASAESDRPSLDEEIARVIVSEEAGPQDPVAPEINTSVFGSSAKTVTQMLEQYRKWSARVYVNDSFPDHASRRLWRKALRGGGEPQEDLSLLAPLEALDARNKYRVAPTTGLWTLFDALTMRLDSGTAEDQLLGQRLQKQWSRQEYLALYEGYEVMNSEEKKAVNAEFGQRYAQVLETVAQEAQRRAPAKEKAA